MHSWHQKSIHSAAHSGRIKKKKIYVLFFLVIELVLVEWNLTWSDGYVMLDHRDYDAESERQKSVEEFFRLQHINQTYDFVSRNFQ
jgi:hypothetical protein